MKEIYKIIKGDKDRVECEVNNLLALGYELRGDLISIGGGYHTFAQCLTLKEEGKNENPPH